MKAPKLPVYDPAKDGNRFEWIIKQAAILHAKEAKQRSNPPRFDYLTGKQLPPAKP